MAATNTALLPATSVHYAAIGTGIAAYTWLVFVAWLIFGHEGEARLPLAIVTVISIMYLGLLAGGGWYSWDVTPERSKARTFGEFLDGPVETATGTISGREAYLQIALMPVALAIGGTIIASIWPLVSS